NYINYDIPHKRPLFINDIISDDIYYVSEHKLLLTKNEIDSIKEMLETKSNIYLNILFGTINQFINFEIFDKLDENGSFFSIKDIDQFFNSSWFYLMNITYEKYNKNNKNNKDDSEIKLINYRNQIEDESFINSSPSSSLLSSPSFSNLLSLNDNPVLEKSDSIL